MTAHPQKPTITPERVEWFAAYFRKHGAWGAFHVALDDGNWKLPVPIEFCKGEEGELDAIHYFNSLTPSQRRRLGQKAEDFAYTIRLARPA